MASERDVVDEARRATGDDIEVAGLFTPRERAMGPPGTHLVVAISPTRVYLLGPSLMSDDSGTLRDGLLLAHTFDRRRVATTIHARASERTLTLEDTWTGERFVLEGVRSPDAHVTATMHVLSDIHELAS